MSKSTVAFRSKPNGNTLLQRRAAQRPPKEPQRGSPFLFFQLPPELRTAILEFMVGDGAVHRDVVSLFRTCEPMYREAAAIFYHDVCLDTTRAHDTADPFLAGPPNRLSPRRFVRCLTINFFLRRQVHLFPEVYGAAVRDMAENGVLESLRLEMWSPFPSPEFWCGFGSGPEPDHQRFRFGKQAGAGRDYYSVRLLVGKGANATEIRGPRFVARPPFQNFLRLLPELGVPSLTLYVASEDHYTFWCPFHRAHRGGQCDGEWKGRAKLLRIKWRAAANALRGARLAPGQ